MPKAKQQPVKLRAGEQMVPLDTIIEDHAFQVRKSINDYHVSRLREVLRAGRQFKDRIVITPDRRLLCGFHRIEAYRKEMPKANDEVPVLVKSFRAERDAYIFAVQDNTEHGEPLDTFDKKCIHVKLRDEYGVKDQRIGAILSVRPSLLDRWNADVVLVPGANKGEWEKKPLKAKHAKMRGEKITHDVYESMEKKHFGTSTLFHIKKINERFDDGTIEHTEDIRDAFAELQGNIADYMAKAETG